MNRIVLLITFSTLLIGCIEHNKEASVSTFNSERFAEVIKEIQIDNSVYTVEKIKNKFGDTDEVMTHSEFESFLTHINQRSIVKSIEHHSKRNNNQRCDLSDNFKILIYDMDNQNYLTVRGTWLGLREKKTDIIPIPFFVSCGEEVFYAGYYFWEKKN